MKVFVSLMGSDTFELNVNETDLIKDIKLKIQKEKKIFFHQQGIAFKGVMLDDSKTLQHYQIKNESTVHLILKLDTKGSEPWLYIIVPALIVLLGVVIYFLRA